MANKDSSEHCTSHLPHVSTHHPSTIEQLLMTARIVSHLNSSGCSDGAVAELPSARGSAWGCFPLLRMPKLQTLQPGLNSAAGSHGVLLIQNKHTNTSLCQGVQIPPDPAPLNPSRRMAATYHQLLPVNGKTIYPDAHVFYRKTFNSM